MNFKSSPRVARVVFSLFILFALIGSVRVETAARGKHPRTFGATACYYFRLR